MAFILGVLVCVCVRVSVWFRCGVYAAFELSDPCGVCELLLVSGGCGGSSCVRSGMLVGVFVCGVVSSDVSFLLFCRGQFFAKPS